MPRLTHHVGARGDRTFQALPYSDDFDEIRALTTRRKDLLAQPRTLIIDARMKKYEQQSLEHELEIQANSIIHDTIQV